GKAELSAQEIINLLFDPIFADLVELDITGGEPHLRSDLVEIINGVMNLKVKHLKRLRSIIVTSNGFLTARIMDSYRTILSQDTEVDLVSVISLDGIGEIHDRIRGTPGAFNCANETITGLMELRREYPQLIVGIKTTVLPINIASLNEIYDFAVEKGLFHIISPVIFTKCRFRNLDSRDKLALGQNEIVKLIDFYSRKELNHNYYYSLMRDYLLSGRRQWLCSAMQNYAFVESDGTIYPCEIIPEAVGNIKSQRFSDIWRGLKAGKIRQKIDHGASCRYCHEPGTIRYSACAEGFTLNRFLKKLGRGGFRKSWQDEGFAKYHH
ncbi:MAG: radical SAM protein, partial [Dehalococcoidales bacterium]|nr:radical SAM protein [Dehalococcoidales bacterium]